MASLGTLVVSVTADTTGYTVNLQNAAGQTKKFSAQVGGMNRETKKGARGISALTTGVQAFVAALAVRKIIAFTGELSRMGMEADKAGRKFNKVFGAEAEKTLAWAKDYGRDFGVSLLDMQRLLAKVQDTLVPLGYARDEAAKMSVALVSMAADIAAFNPEIADANEAINAMISALVGNHEAARAFGVIITEASLKEYALKNSIIDANRELTAQEKVMARMGLMIQGTADAVGAAADEMSELSGQVKKAKSHIDNFKRALSGPVNQVLLEYVSAFNMLIEGFPARNYPGRVANAWLAAMGQIGASTSGPRTQPATAPSQEDVRRALLGNRQGRSNWAVTGSFLRPYVNHLFAGNGRWGGGRIGSAASEAFGTTLANSIQSISVGLRGMFTNLFNTRFQGAAPTFQQLPGAIERGTPGSFAAAYGDPYYRALRQKTDANLQANQQTAKNTAQMRKQQAEAPMFAQVIM